MTRTATVRTELENPDLVARCVRPDNTAEMETTVSGGDVVTRIERDDTGGLQSTLDDYVVNLTVATEVVQHAERHTTHQS